MYFLRIYQVFLFQMIQTWEIVAARKKPHFINPADSPADVIEKLRKIFFKHSLIYLIICKNSFIVK